MLSPRQAKRSAEVAESFSEARADLWSSCLLLLAEIPYFLQPSINLLAPQGKKLSQRHILSYLGKSNPQSAGKREHVVPCDCTAGLFSMPAVSFWLKEKETLSFFFFSFLFFVLFNLIIKCL